VSIRVENYDQPMQNKINRVQRTLACDVPMIEEWDDCEVFGSIHLSVIETRPGTIILYPDDTDGRGGVQSMGL
jgi:hypothetical protein